MPAHTYIVSSFIFTFWRGNTRHEWHTHSLEFIVKQKTEKHTRIFDSLLRFCIQVLEKVEFHNIALSLRYCVLSEVNKNRKNTETKWIKQKKTRKSLNRNHQICVD